MASRRPLAKRESTAIAFHVSVPPGSACTARAARSWARTGSPRYHRARDTAASSRQPLAPASSARSAASSASWNRSRASFPAWTPLARGEIVALGSTARASMASANSSSASALDALLRRAAAYSTLDSTAPLSGPAARRVEPLHPEASTAVEPLPRPLWTTARVFPRGSMSPRRSSALTRSRRSSAGIGTFSASMMRSMAAGLSLAARVRRAMVASSVSSPKRAWRRICSGAFEPSDSALCRRSFLAFRSPSRYRVST